MSKPLSRRSRDFFAGIRNIYSAFGARREGENAEFGVRNEGRDAVTTDWGLRIEERALAFSALFSVVLVVRNKKRWALRI